MTGYKKSREAVHLNYLDNAALPFRSVEEGAELLSHGASLLTKESSGISDASFALPVLKGYCQEMFY